MAVCPYLVDTQRLGEKLSDEISNTYLQMILLGNAVFRSCHFIFGMYFLKRADLRMFEGAFEGADTASLFRRGVALLRPTLWNLLCLEDSQFLKDKPFLFFFTFD